MMEELKLTESDFERIARRLQVEKAVVKAVQQVETAGRGGFCAPGRPVILFEGHIFRQQLLRRGISPDDHTTGNEDVLYRSWTRKYYRGGCAEYERLAKALCIDAEAALSSASWGMFQLMGFNYAACGFGDVFSFVEAMKRNEAAQLDAFAAFLENRNLLPALRQHDWAAFARRYNGPEYRQNRYDTKLREAYEGMGV